MGERAADGTSESNTRVQVETGGLCAGSSGDFVLGLLLDGVDLGLDGTRHVGKNKGCMRREEIEALATLESGRDGDESEW